MNVVAKLRQRGKKDQPPKLLCDIKWLKNVVANFFFFFWVGRTTLNGEKKGMALVPIESKTVFLYSIGNYCHQLTISANSTTNQSEFVAIITCNLSKTRENVRG